MILGVFVCQSLILLAQGVGIIDRHGARPAPPATAGGCHKRAAKGQLGQADRQPPSKPAEPCWHRLTRLEIKADCPTYASTACPPVATFRFVQEVSEESVPPGARACARVVAALQALHSARPMCRAN